MSNEKNNKKEYLMCMLKSIQGEDIGLEEYESIKWFELRGYTYEEARLEVFNKYRAKLLNDNIITRTIVEYQDITQLFSDVFNEENTDEELFERYIDSLTTSFSAICDFSMQNEKLIDPNNLVFQIKEVFIANEIVQGIKRENSYKCNLREEERNEEKEGFSVLEWSTIFYYADSIGAFNDSSNTIERIRKFIEKHSVETSDSYFKNQYYNVKIRINNKNDYPIKKLEKLIPFLEVNYSDVLSKVYNDITFLKTEQSDN